MKRFAKIGLDLVHVAALATLLVGLLAGLEGRAQAARKWTNCPGDTGVCGTPMAGVNCGTALAAACDVAGGAGCACAVVNYGGVSGCVCN